jgi:hypothetical protein
MGAVAVKVGGIYWDRAGARQANAICQELKQVNGAWDESDYFVDLAFLTYVASGEGSSELRGRVSGQAWSGASSGGSLCSSKYRPSCRTERHMRNG